MNEEPANKSHVMTWTLSIMAVPLLYVLSLGPAFYLGYKSNPSKVPPWLAAYSAPMGYVGGTPIQDLANSYIQWWLGLAGEPRLHM